MFQKESPILEDANNLIDMAKQMGLIGAQIKAALPNATNCASWQDIQEPNSIANKIFCKDSQNHISYRAAMQIVRGAFLEKFEKL